MSTNRERRLAAEAKHQRKPEPMLSKEQQEELSRAATEALANLAALAGPMTAAFQQMAGSALQAANKAVEPVMALLREWGMTAGELEAAVRGEALAEEMKSGFRCMRCAGFVRVAPGFMDAHNRLVHGKETS